MDRVEVVAIKVLASKVLQIFRAAGANWQSRIDAALKGWMHTHSLV